MEAHLSRILRTAAAFGLCASLIGCGSPSGGGTPVDDDGGEPPVTPVVLTGTQTVVVEGFDWGPGVTKTIVSFSGAGEIDAASVAPEGFSVMETKESFDWAAYAAWTEDPESADPSVHTTVTEPRIVLDAYLCGPDGERDPSLVSGDTIALELACDPDHGDPYCFDLLTWHNTVPDPYDLEIELTGESVLSLTDGSPVESIEVGASIDLFVDYDRSGEARTPQFIMPQLEGVDLYGSFVGTDGRELRYASYEPADDGETHPLVIWLHGAGEGGQDPTILLLGNKVSALFQDPFQTAMGGAYVLTPQTPDFWLTYNDAGDWQDNPGVPSVYDATLMELIEGYVEAHPGVDPDRVYVGGCSNGGYMTMELILEHPDFFAAAYPICEAYADSGITDGQLESIKDLPVWFIWAENDDTVIPETHEIPTVERLRAIGADVHTSVFPDVVDTSGLYTQEDGSPYEYLGHWSWLYFFNGECQEDGVDLWTWMAAQHR